MTTPQPWGAFALVFALALGTSALLTWVGKVLGVRWNVADQPGGRRRHSGVVSRLGGVGLFGGFLVAVLVAQWLPVPRFDPYEVIRLMGLVLGGVFMFVMGVVDDVYELGPLQLYVAQIVAAAVAVAFLIFIETVNNPLTGQTLGWPYMVTVTVSLLWLGLMMNTVNFLDGLDGLAGGVGAIAGVMLFVHSAFVLAPAQTSVSLLPLALVGACVGFLLFNFAPARVFMGSNGAFPLGYVLAALSVIGGAKMATILMVMGLPLLDLAWQALNRLRQGRNPMMGDRGHLHFRLADQGVPTRRIVLAYYAFCAFFGTLTLVTDSRVFKLVALLTMAALVALGFALVARRQANPSIG